MKAAILSLALFGAVLAFSAAQDVTADSADDLDDDHYLDDDVHIDTLHQIGLELEQHYNLALGEWNNALADFATFSTADFEQSVGHILPHVMHDSHNECLVDCNTGLDNQEFDGLTDVTSDACPSLCKGVFTMLNYIAELSGTTEDDGDVVDDAADAVV